MASSRNVSVDELEALLECPICMETLTSPRSLPCFHNFCKVCLEKYVAGLRDGNNIETFPCPTCRSEFTLKSNENVEGMAGNYFIRNMLEIMNLQQEAKASTCQCCESAAVYRCLTCVMFMCENCCNWHSKWPANKKHTVLSINDISNPEGQAKMKSKLYCKKHQDKTLKFYCETCKELSCTHCMMLTHNKENHSCVSVEEVAQKQREILESNCAALNEILSEGNEALNNISGAMKSLEENASAMKEKIKQQQEIIVKKVVEKLSERAEKMCEEVDEIHNKVHTELNKQHDEMKGYIDKVQGSILLPQSLLTKGSIEEILSSQKVIGENVEKLKNEQPKDAEPVNDGEIESLVDDVPEVTDDINVDDLIIKMGVVVLSGSQSNLSKSSSILKGEVAFIEQLQQWLGNMCKWNLCYRASRDGWRAQDFHRLCDNRGPTTVLIQVNKYIFGGFTDQNWGGEGWRFSNLSFMFSLRNTENLPPFLAPIVSHNYGYAIHCHPAHGPAFGGGHDVFISENAAENQKSFSNFGHSYQRPVFTEKTGGFLLAGGYNFSPTEIEVFI